MDKATALRPMSRAKRRTSAPKREVMRCETASGKAYSVSYSVAKPHKPYRPNEASQLGPTGVDIGALNSVGGWSGGG